MVLGLWLNYAHVQYMGLCMVLLSAVSCYFRESLMCFCPEMSFLSEASYLGHLSHSERRKYGKGMERLREHLNGRYKDTVVLESIGSKFMAVGNAGLSCGFSEDDLRGALRNDDCHLSDHNPEPRILLPADQPYALIEWCCPCHAENAFMTLLQRTVETKKGQRLPVYPAYVSTVPTESSTAFDTGLPSGLIYIADFITPEKEQSLINFVDELLTDEDIVKNGDVLRNRTTLHFGYQFRYGKNDLDFETKIPPIPTICEDVLQRLVDRGCVPWLPDQLTVNVYAPGQGIPPHIDSHSVFEDGICSLSLGGAVVMDFSKDSSVLPVLLQPRSVAAMLFESRFAWKHGIVPRATDVFLGSQSWRRERRISFTFRCAKKTPCDCSYPEHCDSQKGFAKILDSVSPDSVHLIGDGKAGLPAVGLEEEYVYQVYEEIAPHFSETRHKAWPEIARFVATFSPGSIVLDVGCGNGKYMGLNKSVIQIGCDRSSNLLSICRTRGHEVFIADALALPFRDRSCDGVICIAVIHHLSSEERRVQALQEIIRLLVVGGRALVYVWAMEQKKGQKKSTYLKSGKAKDPPLNDGVASPNQESPSSCSLPVHVNRTEFAQQDVLVPWHLKKKADSDREKQEDKVFHRFYHVFREGELRRCCEQLERVDVVSEYYDEGNWCIVLKRTG